MDAYRNPFWSINVDLTYAYYQMFDPFLFFYFFFYTSIFRLKKFIFPCRISESVYHSLSFYLSLFFRYVDSLNVVAKRKEQIKSFSRLLSVSVWFTSVFFFLHVPVICVGPWAIFVAMIHFFLNDDDDDDDKTEIFCWMCFCWAVATASFE